MNTVTDNSMLLRRALQANTAFSFLSGVVMAAAAQPLSDFSGVDPLLLRIVGIGLVVWSAVLLRIVQRPQLRRPEVLIVIAGDGAWVVGTIAVLAVAASTLTTAGVTTLIVLALIVADLGIAQTIGLKRASTT